MTNNNIGKCRLCGNIKPLRESHFIPNSMIKAVKREAACSKIIDSRQRGTNQDFIKTHFLCDDCEALFCNYEKIFKETVFEKLKTQEQIYYNEEKARYFVLSVVWRFMQYDLEKFSLEKYKNLSDEAKSIIACIPIGDNFLSRCEDAKNRERISEQYRTMLLNENHHDIKTVQMHMIPIQRILQCQSYTTYEWLCTAMGVKSYNFNTYKCMVIQIPRLMLLCTIEGKNESLSKFEIGTPICQSVDLSELSKDFKKIFHTGIEQIEKAFSLN